MDGGPGCPRDPIGIVSAVVLARNGDAGIRPLEVQAIGQQFAWKFVYSDYDGVESGELVLPVGREARFTMTSVDVIHSFWVPNFRTEDGRRAGDRDHDPRHARPDR